MLYIYRLARFHHPAEREFNTLEDAIKAAFQDHDSGEAYPKDIFNGETGEIVLDHETLLQKFSEMDTY